MTARFWTAFCSMAEATVCHYRCRFSGSNPSAALGTKMTFKHHRANVGSWHMADLQRPAELGPFMATLPTFGAECLLIAAFQT